MLQATRQGVWGLEARLGGGGSPSVKSILWTKNQIHQATPTTHFLGKDETGTSLLEKVFETLGT